jgi:hypothetical protein
MLSNPRQKTRIDDRLFFQLLTEARQSHLAIEVRNDALVRFRNSVYSGLRKPTEYAMKKFCIVALLALVPTFNSLADCYDSGSVFDGRGNYGEGQLCRFGASDDAPVLPYYQRNKSNYMDYLFSEREQLVMLKSMVIRGKQGNDQVLRQSMANAARPLRPFRSTGMMQMGGF